MTSIRVGAQVRHRSDAALGVGKVMAIDVVAGRSNVIVKWPSVGPKETPEGDLAVETSVLDKLAAIGPASRVPFQLKVFGRWFEARHAITGELSNQPFQMLPHQVLVTNRVINSRDSGRAWLVADDVGLGKTIEAGMVMEVLRKKTLGRFRCLIVTPAGLMPQWQEELARRFGRSFRLFDSRIANDLEEVDQLIASIDTLKMKKFEPALAAVAPWDLVIFDEAHHLATTSDVLTHKLAHSLRTNSKVDNLLFLSATPHSGNNKHFFNMLRLLRPDLFPGSADDYPSVPLSQVMIRNRKSDVTDTHGKKIFRGIAPAKIVEFTPTADEVGFYEQLRDYLRTGYGVANKLQRAKNGQQASAVGFLMSTFGKLASSSRAAIENALKNRLAVLRGEGVESESSDDQRFAGEAASKAVATIAVESPTKGKQKRRDSLIAGEADEVEGLLVKLRSLPSSDSKLEAFVASLRKLGADVKVLIFTEYRATQDVLTAALETAFGNGSVATINGSMAMPVRRQQVAAFNEQRPNPRFMVSTEAGGEGLNMQKSCHTIVNYDLPWNPMALQQRIGRVYRYGQEELVVVVNLKVNSTSEAFADQRVYEYLERKIDEVTRNLAQVQDGQSEDLRGEVLGQVATQFSFDELYKTAVDEGRKKAEALVDNKADHIEQILRDPKGLLGIFKGLQRFDITDYEKVAARVRSEHLDFFVEQYLGHEGVTVQRGPDRRMMFDIPKTLADVGNSQNMHDPYAVRHVLKPERVAGATADKEVAQTSLGSRLLRFGDPLFEAMVAHVQHAGFSDGVASLRLPSAQLGWAVGEKGTWLLFDVRVLRQQLGQTGVRVLRHELVSLLVAQGGEEAVRNDELVEQLHDADDGPVSVREDEIRRAFAIGRAAVDRRLTELLADVTQEYGTGAGILPQEPTDVGVAWLESV